MRLNGNYRRFNKRYWTHSITWMRFLNRKMLFAQEVKRDCFLATVNLEIRASSKGPVNERTKKSLIKYLYWSKYIQLPEHKQNIFSEKQNGCCVFLQSIEASSSTGFYALSLAGFFCSFYNYICKQGYIRSY